MSVLNIIELQNVVTSASGLNATSYLTNQVANIQEMVQYDQKRINVNVISNFDISPIQFVSPVNFSNDISVSGTSIAGTTTSLSTIGTSIGNLTIGGSANLLELKNNSSTPFYITSTGAVTFTGPIIAQNFITSSDGKKKMSIRPITNYTTILSSITGVHFKWISTNQDDIGVIAQDLQGVLPEAVVETPDGLQVAYMKIIPVLIEAIKDLTNRITAIERGFNIFHLDD